GELHARKDRPWRRSGPGFAIAASFLMLALTFLTFLSKPRLQDPLPTVTPGQAQDEKFAELIQKLDSDDISVREQAQRSIERLGRIAGPAIADALRRKDLDPEVRRRLRDSARRLAKGGNILWKIEGIVQGRYLAADSRVYAPTKNGELLCLDGASGKELWKISISGAIGAIATGASGKVLVGSENRVYYLDPIKGETLWETKLPDPVNPYVERPALVWESGGKAYIVGEKNYRIDLLYCLDLSNGKVQWTFTEKPWEENGVARMLSLGPPIVEGRLVAVHHYFGAYGLDAATGTRIWHVAATGHSRMKVQADAEKVYFSPFAHQGDIKYLSLKDGSELRKAKGYSLFLAGGRLYSVRDQLLESLSADTGKVLWPFEAPQPIRKVAASQEGFAYVLTHRLGDFTTAHDTSPPVRRLYCLDKDGGQRIWDLPTDGLWTDLQISQGKIFVEKVENSESTIYCINGGDREMIRLLHEFTKD
ncbi:MAG TPA: PQQ-binding-like beta-propeller repeat protein, partial [Salinarimonas sp.]|nr:PQQ-binding-like beta-propeller repeat protein [Salinarimonas sp.]